MALAEAGATTQFIGDIDNDGLQDLMPGAPGTDTVLPSGGAAYLVYGSPAGLPASGTISSATNAAVLCADRNDKLGSAMVGLGDIHGDGIDDFDLGAPGYDYSSGSTDNGAVYILFGTQKTVTPARTAGTTNAVKMQCTEPSASQLAVLPP